MLLYCGMHEMVCEEGKKSHGTGDAVYADRTSYQGDEIVGTRKISFPFLKLYNSRQSDMRSEMKLLASNSANPEEHESDHS